MDISPMINWLYLLSHHAVTYVIDNHMRLRPDLVLPMLKCYDKPLGLYAWQSHNTISSTNQNSGHMDKISERKHTKTTQDINHHVAWVFQSDSIRYVLGQRYALSAFRKVKVPNGSLFIVLSVLDISFTHASFKTSLAHFERCFNW